MRTEAPSTPGGAAWQAPAQGGLAAEFRGMAALLDSSVAALPAHARQVAAEQLAGGRHQLRAGLLGGVWHGLGGRDVERAARAMAVVELVHLSTLLHDRVADGAVVDTSVVVPPNAGLVLGGDAVVVGALLAAQALGPAAVECTLAALQRLIGAELLELKHRGRAHVPHPDAVDMARLRTGALWRLCAELPVAVLGVPVDRALGDAMEALGLAWHWGVDLAEFRDAGAGRRALVDLREGSGSTLVSEACGRHRWLGGALQQAARRALPEARITRLVQWGIRRAGAAAHVEREQAARLQAGLAQVERVVHRSGSGALLWDVLGGCLPRAAHALAA